MAVLKAFYRLQTRVIAKRFHSSLRLNPLGFSAHFLFRMSDGARYYSDVRERYDTIHEAN